MLRKVVCILVIGLFALGVFGGITQAQKAMPPIVKKAQNPTTKYTTHAPIRINNDTDFTTQFANRTIWGLEINGSGKGFCIYIGNCSLPFTVKNCYFHNATGKNYVNYFSNTGIFLYKSSNGTLYNNNCNGNLEYGIFLVYSNTSILMDNNCTASYYGIFLNNSNVNTLMHNTCNRNTYYGIGMEHSNSNTLVNNTCIGNSGSEGYGIWAWVSITNMFIGNNCNENRWDGINLIFADTSTLTNNTCIGNYDGICLDYCNRDILSYNNISSNSHYGITIALKSGPSSFNRIYHNNFMNSVGTLARDDFNTNFWNSSYPFGGNYWFNWTTPDNKSGPNQNLSGPDGIVDSPYILNGTSGAKDFYPLVNPISDAGAKVPETPLSPFPLIIISVILFTIIVVRLRKR